VSDSEVEKLRSILRNVHEGDESLYKRLLRDLKLRFGRKKAITKPVQKPASGDAA